MAGVTPDSPAARSDPNVAASEFAGVGAIVIGGNTYSGVVIARQHVLTAGHVGSAGAASAMSFVRGGAVEFFQPASLNRGPRPVEPRFLAAQRAWV
jgi:hypothetical protein